MKWYPAVLDVIALTREEVMREQMIRKLPWAAALVIVLIIAAAVIVRRRRK